MGVTMNLYRVLGEHIGTQAARDLAERLVAWHDAMVAHERRLQNRLDGECADECPHVDARSLWAEAVDTFGRRAEELVFLVRHGSDRAQAVGQ